MTFDFNYENIVEFCVYFRLGRAKLIYQRKSLAACRAEVGRWLSSSSQRRCCSAFADSAAEARRDSCTWYRKLASVPTRTSSRLRPRLPWHGPHGTPLLPWPWPAEVISAAKRLFCESWLFSCRFCNFQRTLHFHALDLDAPWISCVVQRRLHRVRNRLTFSQQFGQVPRPENVSQSSGCQQASRVAVVRHLQRNHFLLILTIDSEYANYLNDGFQWVRNAVVDDCVDRNCDGILGQNLLRRHIEWNRPQVHLAVVVDAWQHKEHSGASSAAGSISW